MADVQSLHLPSGSQVWQLCTAVISSSHPSPGMMMPSSSWHKLTTAEHSGSMSSSPHAGPTPAAATTPAAAAAAAAGACRPSTSTATCSWDAACRLDVALSCPVYWVRAGWRVIAAPAAALAAATAGQPCGSVDPDSTAVKLMPRSQPPTNKTAPATSPHIKGSSEVQQHLARCVVGSLLDHGTQTYFWCCLQHNQHCHHIQ